MFLLARTLVMKIADDETFGYSSSYWEDDTLLNENSPVDERVNAKYQAFLNVSFTDIQMCVESENSNCYTHSLDREWRSAKDLFSAGMIKDTTFDQAKILSAFDVTTGHYQVCQTLLNSYIDVYCLQDIFHNSFITKKSCTFISSKIKPPLELQIC